MFHSHFHFVCDRHEEFKSSLHSRSYLSQSYSYSNYNLISNESKQKRITPCLVVPISFFSSVVFSSSPISCGTSSIKLITLLSSLSLSLLDLVRQVSFFSKHNTQKKNHTGSSNYYSFFLFLSVDGSRSTVPRSIPLHVFSTPPSSIGPPDLFSFPRTTIFSFRLSTKSPKLHETRFSEIIQIIQRTGRSANIYREDRKSPIYHSFIFSVEGWLVLL